MLKYAVLESLTILLAPDMPSALPSVRLCMLAQDGTSLITFLCFVGPSVLSQQHSESEASEDAESIASQLQPLRSGELQAQASVPDLNELEGGSMMALPKEPSRQSVASGYGPPVSKGHCAAMQPSFEL